MLTTTTTTIITTNFISKFYLTKIKKKLINKIHFRYFFLFSSYKLELDLYDDDDMNENFN